jgi:hypothetical protein
MSDEPKKPRRKWFSRAIATLIVLASYEATHYATVEHVLALGSDHVCRRYDQHMIGYKPVPAWVESAFAPAECIDAIPVLVRNHPWHQF